MKLNEATSTARMRFTLPTEAQWENACRAGTTTYWHCGDGEDTLQEYDWFGKDAEENFDEMAPSHRVGQLRPNPFGLYDMHGNVSEWCADWQTREYVYYTKSPVEDPAGPTSGYARIYRGGGASSYSPAWRCRSAWRGWNGSSERAPHRGFRLVGILPD